MQSCVHTIKRGKFANSQCRNTAHHNGYCWKHIKKTVSKEVAAAVGIAAPSAEKAIKYKFSAFRFTVNSNTSHSKITPEKVREFKRLIGFVFDKENVVEYLVDRTNKDPKANLDDVQTAYHFEIAPTTGAIHCHRVVRLKHHGNYIMSIDVIRDIIGGAWGKKYHFNVKADGDSNAAWEQYMAKNAGADKL